MIVTVIIYYVWAAIKWRSPYNHCKISNFKVYFSTIICFNYDFQILKVAYYALYIVIIFSTKFAVDWLQNNELTLNINNEDEWGKVI